MLRPETHDVLTTYNFWRLHYKTGWGLAWYLAVEISERFHCSHGIRPEVIAHEGLGYYGIAIQQRPCQILHRARTLGRFTMSGNVENWTVGSPGDHGLNFEHLEERGVSPESFISEVVRHLRLEINAEIGHHFCRHKRWGASFLLVFRLAALIALRWNHQVQIWNNPDDISKIAAQVDPKRYMTEHPGYLVINHGRQDVLFACDGRVLKPAGHTSLWHRYMTGDSVHTLLCDIEKMLGLM